MKVYAKDSTAVHWVLVAVRLKLMNYFVFIGLKTKVWLLSVGHRRNIYHGKFCLENEKNWFEIFFP